MGIRSNTLIFEQISDLKEVKKKSAKGAASIFLSQVISLLINVASLAILARLLEPKLFGLIGMVMAITNFAAVFQDLGFSMATVQSEKLTHDQVSSLFWINSLFGFIVMAVICMASPCISAFYGQSDLVVITIAISTSFFFGGMGVQHQALLRRRMQFYKLTVLRCGSLFLAHTLAVSLAILGGGIWSLASIPISTPIFLLMGCIIVLPWYPSLPKRKTNLKHLLEFGWNITGFDIINYFSRNLDNILIGRFLGSTALGFYSKAYELMMLPLTRLRGPIIGVATPALGGLRGKKTEYRDYFLKMLSLLSMVTFPLIGCLILCAEDLVYLALGSQWAPAAKIFRWLGVAAIVQPFNFAIGILLVSSNQTGRYLKWGGITSLFIVTAFFVGLTGGSVGIAKAYAAVNLVLFLPSIIFCTKVSPITTWDFLSSLLHPFGVSVFCGFVTWSANAHLDTFQPVFRFLVTLVVYLTLYVSCSFALPRSRASIISGIRLARNSVSL